MPPDEIRNAYLNRPLSIGHGQTISQPLIVALMTDLMQIKRGDTVLCEGTEVRAFCIQHPDDPGRIKAIPVPEDIKAAGGLWEDQEVVVDGNLITARKPEDLTAFCRALINASRNRTASGPGEQV